MAISCFGGQTQPNNHLGFGALIRQLCRSCFCWPVAALPSGGQCWKLFRPCLASKTYYFPTISFYLKTVPNFGVSSYCPIVLASDSLLVNLNPWSLPPRNHPRNPRHTCTHGRRWAIRSRRLRSELVSPCSLPLYCFDI